MRFVGACAEHAFLLEKSKEAVKQLQAAVAPQMAR
jgi:hypothetical protein